MVSILIDYWLGEGDTPLPSPDNQTDEAKRDESKGNGPAIFHNNNILINK